MALITDPDLLNDKTGSSDHKFAANGAMTAADPTLTSATITFGAGDVGKFVTVEGAGAGGSDLITTILSFTSATSVELNTNALTTVSGSDVLVAGTTEVFIDTTAKTIRLSLDGNLSTDGVTMKALYSFLKEEWKNDPFTKNLAAFPFPMTPITDESFELIDGWNFVDFNSRYLIRTGGWTVRNTSGAVTEKWAGIIGLGSIESNDQLYYSQSGVISNVQLRGQVNQAVQILSDPNGDGAYGDGYDRRTSFTLYVREQGQIFGQAGLTDIGVTSMDSIAYRFPISTSSDLKINTVDTGIKATGTGFPADVVPFSGMTITYAATPQARAGLTGGSFNFGIIIDGNGQSLQEVYNFVQYALRQSNDINAGTPSVITGKIASPLLRYVGDTLYTIPATNPDGGGTGVFIDNFDSADQNSVFFVDNLGTERSYPYIATLTLSFNANLVSDGSAEYWVYFTTTPGGSDWGETAAIIVDDASAVDMVGNIVGASVTRTFDFDANVQGGRVPPAVPDITAIAIGLGIGQYVRATGTIARSKSNAIALVAPLERNYSNL
jgi:hypothetical protein